MKPDAPDGSHYIQRSLLRLANESPEPVFNVHIVVARGNPPVPIGPLAAPTPLPLLPARHRRTWDVTLGLLANGGQVASLGVEPTVEIFFTDVRGARWHRGFSGELTDSGTLGAKLLKEIDEANEAQLGDLDNPFNPLPVALAFLGALTSTEPPPTVDALQVLFAPNAPGWASMTDAGLEALGDELREYGMAAHAWYPAPFVAWVRAVHDDDARSDARPGEFRTVRAKILTLCFLPSLGWRVFSIGAPMEPDWIGFPPGTLSDDPRAVTDVSDEEPIT